MKIKFLGAAGTVTGSSYLLTGEQNQTLLIDLGMFQGIDDDDKFNSSPLSFDATTLTGVVLTHAHLDHCGRLPLLVKNGFAGKIYTTPATKEITHISLLDAANLQDEDKKDAPLYTKDDVEKVCGMMETVDYDQKFTLGEFNITFRNAGHILGSSSIEITNNDKTLVFSGDLGNTPETIIQPTEYITQADVVIMESTYGNTTHPVQDAKALLEKAIETTQANKGVLLIPCFAIERTQEILYVLSQLNVSIPVYLDSPMAIEVTQAFKNFKQLYNTNLSSNPNPFGFPSLQITKTTEESKAINKAPTPKIIIAGSGMMSGGRILHHLNNYLSFPTTQLLVVGYQAAGTLGRTLLDGAKSITIYDEKIEVNATITKLEAFSSHADEPKLLEWLKQIKGVKKVFLTHGEDPQRMTLKDSIIKNLGIQDISLPKKEEEFEINN